LSGIIVGLSNREEWIRRLLIDEIYGEMSLKTARHRLTPGRKKAGEGDRTLDMHVGNVPLYH
jgi:hypothetical protein